VIREQQAEDTKKKILDAAEKLFVERGYSETAIAAIATKAGVAPQTIYAAFGSKPALIIALIDRMRQDKSHMVRYIHARDTGVPTAVIPVIVSIVCEVYSTRSIFFERLLDAFSTSPDLREMVVRKHLEDRELIRPAVTHLSESGRLRQGLDPEEALDVLWALTSVPIYLHLVMGRKWSLAHYANWLEGILMRELCGTGREAETD